MGKGIQCVENSFSSLCVYLFLIMTCFFVCLFFINLPIVDIEISGLVVLDSIRNQAEQLI